MTTENPYTTQLYTQKNFKTIKQKVNVGIDEAGRGPVLGHLVYAALICDQTIEINDAFKDSKILTKTQRQFNFEVIEKKHSFIYTAIHPKYISTNMNNKTKMNLNQMSYNTVINIIKEIEKSYEINTIYLDALGPIETYRKQLQLHFGKKYNYIIETKADSKYVIVSGASIIAKVNRDDLLENWNLKDKDCGSGYPGDDITKKWLDRNFCKIKGFPEIVRTSWSTAKQYLQTIQTKKRKFFDQLGVKKKN